MQLGLNLCNRTILAQKKQDVYLNFCRTFLRSLSTVRRARLTVKDGQLYPALSMSILIFAAFHGDELDSTKRKLKETEIKLMKEENARKRDKGSYVCSN